MTTELNIPPDIKRFIYYLVESMQVERKYKFYDEADNTKKLLEHMGFEVRINKDNSVELRYTQKKVK